MTIKAVLHTNQASIDRVLRAGLPVMLVFWDLKSDTSGNAILDALAEEYGGRVLIAKVNAAEEEPLVQRYNLEQIPSVVFVKEGKTEAILPGPVDEPTLRRWLDYLTAGGTRPQSATQSAQTANGSQANTKPIQLTDSNFERMIHSDKPVLVDFWAEWCGPCRMLGPSIEQLAKEFAGRAVIGKLNVDENRQTARRFNIMSIPAIYIFKNGNVIDQVVGAQPLPVLRQWLSRHV